MYQPQHEPTPFTIAGTMTRDQVRNYVYQLKCFLASKETVKSFEEQHMIEAEIANWEKVKEISTKIVGK